VLRLVVFTACVLMAGCSDSTEAGVGPGQSDSNVFFGGKDTTSIDAVDLAEASMGPETTEGCDCPPKMHCNADDLCESDVCSKGQTTCASPTSLKLCAADGSGFEESACPNGQICETGECKAPICQPNEPDGCEGYDQRFCNSLGTGYFALPCGGGKVCEAGECKPVAPNIIMMVDTSGSMNWLVNGTKPNECFGGNCPPWTFPSCEDPVAPKTRLGLVKAALQAVVASESAANLRLALQRFPQIPFTEDDFFGLAPTCEGGYWEYTPGIVMTGDNNQKTTQLGSWFTQAIDEIVPFPFSSAGATNLQELAKWFDFNESIAPTQGSCWDSNQCGGGPCIGGSCQFFTNPELRAVGATPIGKSLFYAGEYLKHFVLVEGKACQDTVDCGSPHHTCVDGACHDPFAECRPNVIIAFTDGAETENVHINDFFHPRVQAKRMQFGLGCKADEDCLSGAFCLEGVCRPPAGVVDEEALTCETGGLSCNSTWDCPDPCATFGGCQGECLPTAVQVVDNLTDANVLRDWSGNPVTVKVNIVDASGQIGANELVARYGGGKHFSVNLDDPNELVNTFGSLLGDAKSGAACGEE
jgi:hypothetical protein